MRQSINKITSNSKVQENGKWLKPHTNTCYAFCGQSSVLESGSSRTSDPHLHKYKDPAVVLQFEFSRTHHK